MAAVGFIARSAPPGYVMLNSLKDSLIFPDGPSCYCNSCHKFRLRLHRSLVHQALHVPSEKEIQWSQGRGARWPGYWAPTSNPSVAKSFIQIQTILVQCAGAPSCWNHISRRTSKGFIQILTDDISAVCRGAIMLEPHFTTNFQRHHFQQLG
jgi:hypothetical protein